MPWEAILGGVTGGAAIAIVLGVLFAKSLTDKIVEAAQMRFESALKRAEEMHKVALAMASAIDTDLRGRRFTVYAELWKKTGTLPQWPRNPEVTYSDLGELTGHLRDWYFINGGIYLSATARSAYGEVQETIISILDKKQSGLVSDSDYESIRKKCSSLRTELTRDLLSRREAPALSEN